MPYQDHPSTNFYAQNNKGYHLGQLNIKTGIIVIRKSINDTTQKKIKQFETNVKFEPYIKNRDKVL